MFFLLPHEGHCQKFSKTSLEQKRHLFRLSVTYFFFFSNNFRYTQQPLYNTVYYNTALDITRFKDGSKKKKCIDYTEK